MVVEKPKAIEEAQELIGKFGIKLGSDFEKKKRKTQIGYNFMNNYNHKSADNSLINEYGSYMFCFPNAERNKEKILSEFRSLPASKEYRLERVN